MKTKNVLIIHTSDLSRAPRVLKQIEALKSEYNIATIGTREAGIKDIDFYRFDDHNDYTLSYKTMLLRRLITHKYNDILNDQSGLWRVENVDSIKKPELIISHDPSGLFLTIQLLKERGWKCRILYDAHEYEPKHYGSLKYQWINRPNLRFLRDNAKAIDSFITVAPTLAREYERYLGIEENSVEVVYNAPFFHPAIKPSLTGDRIRLVVHSIADPSRKLELMIEVMKLLPSERFSLDMYLVESDHEYYTYLTSLANNTEGVRICRPVTYTEILPMLHKYDIAFCSIFPSSFSLKYCLPNKFFEAIQARLAIVIGPSPEMRTILEKYQLGICAERFTAEQLAKAIEHLKPTDVDRFKQNADRCAYEMSAEKGMETIRTIVGRLLKEQTDNFEYCDLNKR